MTDLEYLEFIDQYPVVPRINRNDMVDHNLHTEEETEAFWSLGMQSVIGAPEQIELSLEQVRNLFERNVVRFILESAGYFAHGKDWYNVSFHNYQGDGIEHPFIIVDREYVDNLPKIVAEFMSEINVVKRGLYLNNMPIDRIKNGMAFHGLELPEGFEFKMQQFLMQRTSGFRRGLDRAHNIPEALSFAKIVSFLPVSEQIKLSEVCSNLDNATVITNRNESPGDRTRFDRRFGLSIR